MKPVIKICGLREADNIIAINRLGPDLLGFIFYPGSPRFVGHDFHLPDELPLPVRTGVFVNEKLSDVFKTALRHHLAYVQLHGSEDAAYVSACRAEGLKVIKTVSVSAETEWGSLDECDGLVDFFLFDTAGPLRGGHGVAFDWSHLVNYRGVAPFLLSGGLRMELASQLKNFNHSRLAGYDINSGVEDRPGVKSGALTARMIDLLKKNEA